MQWLCSMFFSLVHFCVYILTENLWKLEQEEKKGCVHLRRSHFTDDEDQEGKDFELTFMWSKCVLNWNVVEASNVIEVQICHFPGIEKRRR